MRNGETSVEEELQFQGSSVAIDSIAMGGSYSTLLHRIRSPVKKGPMTLWTTQYGRDFVEGFTESGIPKGVKGKDKS